jgi:hypothetical protein
MENQYKRVLGCLKRGNYFDNKKKPPAIRRGLINRVLAKVRKNK